MPTSTRFTVRGLAIMGAIALAGAVAMAGCTAPPGDAGTERGLPPAGADFDYQLGGDYDPAPGVEVVARDSTSAPASGLYNICYVNGFQTQPGEGDGWLDEHPELVLHDESGTPFADPGWPDEYLLDTSSEEKRAGILERLLPVLQLCADKRFDAVEIDNLDSWTRSDGALTLDDNVALASSYVQLAHDLGLAIAQKNGAGSSQLFRDEVGFDFVVSEQCMRYQECADYLDAYDGLVFDIEYPVDTGEFTFDVACDDPGRPASMILRDLDLAPEGEPGHMRETC